MTGIRGRGQFIKNLGENKKLNNSSALIDSRSWGGEHLTAKEGTQTKNPRAMHVNHYEGKKNAKIEKGS